MKIIKFLGIFLLMATVTVSCKKDEDKPTTIDSTVTTPTPPTVNHQTSDLTINGDAETLNNFTAQLGFNSLTLSGQTDSGDSLIMYISEFVGEATYSFASQQNVGVFVNSFGTQFTVGGFSGGTGNFTISSYNANNSTISGTYSLNAVNQSGAISVISDGTFTNLNLFPYQSFHLLEPFSISNENLDFAQNEPAFFNAVFDRPVSNISIEIVGDQSGASKTINIFSTYDVLDQTNNIWQGDAEDIWPIFYTEPCTATLRLYVAEEDAWYDYTCHFNISETILLNTENSVLVSSFENGLNYNWLINPIEFFQINTEEPTFFGEQSLSITGSNLPVSIEFSANNIDQGAYEFFPLSSDANDVYINLFLKNTGENSLWIPLKLYFEEFNNGVNIDDIYGIEYTFVIEPEWTYYSFKYSQLYSTNFGNGIKQPHKVKNFILELNAPENTEILVDHIIFTDGGPLVP